MRVLFLFFCLVIQIKLALAGPFDASINTLSQGDQSVLLSLRESELDPLSRQQLPKAKEKEELNLRTPTSDDYELINNHNEKQVNANNQVIRSFAFEGNTVMKSAEILKEISSFVGQPINLKNIEAIELAVFNIYMKKGLLAKSSIPAQDLSSGSIKVKIYESHLGKIKVTSPPNLRYNPSKAMAIMENNLRGKIPLSVKEIEGAAKVVDLRAGISAEVDLVPGDDPLGTDISLKLKNTAWSNLVMQMDNLGLAATGRDRKALNWQINGPFKQGEKFILGYLHTQGSDMYSIDYEQPVGSRGEVVVIGARTMDYRVINNKVLGVDGIGGDSNSQWIKVRVRKFTALDFVFNSELGLEHSKNNDQIELSGLGNVVIGDKSTISYYGQVSSTWVDSSATKSVNLSSRLTSGKLDISNPSQMNSDSLGAKTNGDFIKINLDGTYQQKLTDKDFLNILFSAQVSNKNLDRQQKIMMTGASAIRAFDSGMVSADEGMYLQAEVSHLISEKITVSTFFDYANFKQNHKTWSDWSPQNLENSDQLYGVGFGVKMNPTKWLSATGQYARKIGACNSCTANPQDDRAWLIGTVSF